LGKYISENSDAKVIFNGDGSDELLGGYLYMYLAPDPIEFDKEVRRLLRDIHMYDVLRSDKSMGSNGLESRSPFLDRAFVQYYLSIPPQVRFHTPNDKCEKYLLRIAFSGKYYRNSANMKLLPDEVLWRTKEAFSDGVTSKKLSLFQIIDVYAREMFMKEHMAVSELVKHDIDMRDVGGHLVPTTPEQYMYRKIFETHYRGVGTVVPYFWMPKYVDATDPSARTLEIYDEEEESSDVSL
jgi:asparagine synthase (glutamine-hydrolysing)